MKKTTIAFLIFCFAITIGCNNSGSSNENNLLAGATLVGTTYYVAATGNDATGDGSQTKPWKTLAKATAMVTTPGDVIHLNPGTYTETAQSNLAVGVSIEGADKNTTIINSTQTGTWSNFLNLESPTGTAGNQSISNLTLNGGYVSASNFKTSVAIWITGRSNVSIHDCIIKNWQLRGVIFNGITTDNPGKDIGGHATGNKFYNNTVLNSAAYENGNGHGALNIGFQMGMEIYGNTIQQTERPEGQNGWPIKYWNQGWLKGVKIHDNVLIKKPYGGSYPGATGWDFAIEFFNISGLEIYNNQIQGAIDLNYNYKGQYEFSAWIHNNVLDHPVLNSKVEGAIILEYRTESCVIENNIINNKTYGVTFNTRGVNDYGGDNLPAPGGTPVGGYSYLLNNIIRNNLFSNMYVGSGIGNRFAIGAISENDIGDIQINNLQIYNNTIVAKSSDAPNYAIDFSSGGKGNGTGIDVHDNIVVGFVGGWWNGSSPTKMANVIFQTNMIWNCGNSNAPIWPGGNPTNYTYVPKIANPLLTASFVPGPGSPAIGGGSTGGNIGWLPGSPPPPPGNVNPTANAGPDKTITLPVDSVVLIGSGNDPDGSIASYQWKSGSTIIGNEPVITIRGLTAGTYTYSLMVVDNLGATGTDNVVITVKPVVPPPARTLLYTIHCYTNKSISKSFTSTKTLFMLIRVYSDKTTETIPQ